MTILVSSAKELTQTVVIQDVAAQNCCRLKLVLFDFVIKCCLHWLH